MELETTPISAIGGPPDNPSQDSAPTVILMGSEPWGQIYQTQGISATLSVTSTSVPMELFRSAEQTGTCFSRSGDSLFNMTSVWPNPQQQSQFQSQFLSAINGSTRHAQALRPFQWEDRPMIQTKPSEPKSTWTPHGWTEVKSTDLATPQQASSDLMREESC